MNKSIHYSSTNYQWLLAFILVLISNSIIAQGQNVSDTAITKSKLISFYGESRNIFMSTINEGAYKDDYAFAAGIVFGVKIKPVKNLEFGVSGATIFNLYSSDLSEPDPVSGGINRYELGLFDVTDPGNANQLSQLEDIYFLYTNKSQSIKAGRFVINNPFINPQDGRMRPTYTEGIWINQQLNSKIQLNGGFITRIMPRSVRSWNRPGNTIGFYPSGRDENGAKSKYPGNIKSNGVAILNLNLDLKNNWNIDVWNGYIDNVLNTITTEITHNKKVKSAGGNWYQGVILLHQDAINNGGNEDPSLTYATKKSSANAISIQTGYEKGKLNTSLNYTHITGDGRYLMPREWGKEIFYTFLPRERNEGAGNTHSFMIQSKFTSNNKKISGSLGYGYYILPDINDTRLNKYAMPTYHQINFDFRYVFQNKLKGLEYRTLIAYKIGEGETYNNPKNVYNKVDIINLNFILTYKL